MRSAAAWVVGCLALAGLSLLGHSATTYDPWAWIVWGREIVHLDLSTVAGPSWKPLPVLFTMPFSLAGGAAPDLWLVVARAGTLGALVVAWKLAARLAGGGAPGVVAGAAAALGLGAAPWFFRNATLGNSEALLVLCVLAAAHRHLDGRRGQAFALAIAAGLLRPEAWPFIGLYALWLAYEDRARLPWLAGGLLLLPALWLLPELWGSGDAFRAGARATDANPGSPTFADHPALEVVREAGRLLPWVTIAGLAIGAALLAARRVPAGRAGPALGLLGLGVAWLAVVAVMTEGGFSGNQRYLIMPVACACVAGGAALGWAARAAAGSAGDAGARAAAAAAAIAVVTVVALQYASPLDRVFGGLAHQARVAGDLEPAIDAAGGRERLLRCGDPYTGPFLVPLVAWHLEVHTVKVGLRARRPAVVFRAAHVKGAPVAPSTRALGSTRTLARNRSWRIAAACGR